jgi:F-type H+-transporting ATPase subunit b
MLAMLTRAGLFLAEGAAAEGGSEVVEEKAVNPVIPELNEAFWTLVFFLLLLALVRYVLLPPIMKMREEREVAINAGRDAADRAQTEVARARAEYDAALAGARVEASQLIDAARAEADAYRVELQAAADAELAAARQAAADEITGARASALTSVRGDVTDLAVGAASAVVQRPLDRAAQTAIVERALAARN